MLGTTGAACETAAGGGVAGVLEQLGRPEQIAREAAEDGEPGRGALAPDQLAGSPSGGQVPGPWRPVMPEAVTPRRGILKAVTVVLLLLSGGFLIGLGWLAGVVLLWASPRWDTRDKLLGTLIWPGGLAAVLAVPRFGAGLPPVLVLGLLLIGVAGPVLVAIRLLRGARPVPARPAGPAALPAA